MAGLPFLPGLSFDSKLSQTRFNKPQGLQFANNTPIVDFQKPGIGGSPVATSRGTVPGWLAYDKQVLCFQAYFTEDYHPEDGGRARIRNCKVLFYLEDDTIQINEKAQENSGIPQGTMIRRHRIPKPAPNDETFYGVQDLNVGQEVTFYGRHFQLTGCDDFTRQFLTKSGMEVPPSEEVAQDLYLTQRTARVQAAAEPHRQEKNVVRKQFLECDRKVLRFFCVWDDNYSGPTERRFMVLRYFLADDTTELFEVFPRNSGRDGPVFLKRQKLPKQIASLVKPLGASSKSVVLNVIGDSMFDKSARSLLDTYKPSGKDFYTEADFHIGSVVEIFGRPFLIYDCDEFTKEYYASKYGVTEFNTVAIEEEKVEPVPRLVPPPTGYGTEEDSMVSVRSLIPIPPKKAPGKFLPKGPCKDADTYILRFLARLADPGPIDHDRVFIVYYYLTDDTMAVFEQPAPNSGIKAGKFADRAITPSPSGKPYEATDLFLGAQIELRKFKFALYDADEYALAYMENNHFPFSQADHITSVIRASGQNEAVQAALRARDPQNTGSLSLAGSREALRTALPILNDHEILTVARAHLDAAKQVQYPALLAALASSSVNCL